MILGRDILKRGVLEEVLGSAEKVVHSFLGDTSKVFWMNYTAHPSQSPGALCCKRSLQVSEVKKVICRAGNYLDRSICPPCGVCDGINYLPLKWGMPIP